MTKRTSMLILILTFHIKTKKFDQHLFFLLLCNDGSQCCDYKSGFCLICSYCKAMSILQPHRLQNYSTQIYCKGKTTVKTTFQLKILKAAGLLCCLLKYTTACKHNENQEIILEDTPKSVFYLDQRFCTAILNRMTTPKSKQQ